MVAVGFPARLAIGKRDGLKMIGEMGQEAHHRKMTFEQEFIALLKKHGVEFDPRYVFD